MDVTARFGISLLVPGQIQKEWIHNEAVVALDLLLGGLVDEGPRTAPPSSPVNGRLYLVADSAATGAFAGQERKLAGWTQAGWRFIAPAEGMRLTASPSGVDFHYRDGAWESGSVRAEEIVVGGTKVVGEQAAAVVAPSGGTIVDVEARACLASVLAALRGHGLIAS